MAVKKRRTTPTWHREAVERGIDSIVFFLEQAEGFVWSPSRPEGVFGLGGTHVGTYPVSATYVWEQGREQLGDRYLPRIRWFLPFLEKIVQGEDFSLDDLELERRPSVRVISASSDG